MTQYISIATDFDPLEPLSLTGRVVLPAAYRGPFAGLMALPPARRYDLSFSLPAVPQQIEEGKVCRDGTLYAVNALHALGFQGRVTVRDALAAGLGLGRVLFFGRAIIPHTAEVLRLLDADCVEVMAGLLTDDEDREVIYGAVTAARACALNGEREALDVARAEVLSCLTRTLSTVDDDSGLTAIYRAAYACLTPDVGDLGMWAGMQFRDLGRKLARQEVREGPALDLMTLDLKRAVAILLCRYHEGETP